MPPYKRERWKERPYSSSGLKGVLYFPRCTKAPWKAYIRHHGQYICIGYYETKLEAAIAYNKHALKLYGPDAYFNRLAKEYAVA